MLAIGKLCSTLLKSEELSDRDRETRDALLERLVVRFVYSTELKKDVSQSAGSYLRY